MSHLLPHLLLLVVVVVRHIPLLLRLRRRRRRRMLPPELLLLLLLLLLLQMEQGDASRSATSRAIATGRSRQEVKHAANTHLRRGCWQEEAGNSHLKKWGELYVTLAQLAALLANRNCCL